ncbi:MAG: hypothetical protein ACI8SR_001611 [Oceanicoccus sp.]|jgi:hypothetical protein
MKILLSVFLMTMLSVVAQAKEVAGVNLPDSLSAQDQSLALNGVGIRSKFFMDIYAAGLYLSETSKEAKSIIEQDKPMALRLHITSGLLTAEKMESATREGFEKSTGGNTAAIKTTIDSFIATFQDGIVENDVFDFVYVPAVGVNVFKNDKLKTTVEGLEFKQALFGIWLSEDAVQDDLKEGLLGSL